jgi:hypothetical protein
MVVRPIDKLERQLQDLIEGAFTRLFRRATSARDIALLLLRAMEDNALQTETRGNQSIAPDSYTIFLHPDSAREFLTRIPDFPARLAALITELGSESGYWVCATPAVRILADPALETHQARVAAEHNPQSSAKTARMAPVSAVENARQSEPAPHLYSISLGIMPLTKSVINIGRERSNDLVICDAFVSRHHLQLRKRFGQYTLVDANSRGGTLVNNIAVYEHLLQDGDVIRLGRTELVYGQDRHLDVSRHTTRTMRQD